MVECLLLSGLASAVFRRMNCNGGISEIGRIIFLKRLLLLWSLEEVALRIRA